MTAIPDRARLVRVPFGSGPAPELAPLLVAGDERPFALVGGWAESRAICGSHPLATAGEDPFAALDARIDVDDAVPGAVGGGWFGALGYGLARRLEAVPPPPRRPVPLPAHTLAFHDHVLRCDADGVWWFEALWTPGRAAALDARLAVLRARVAAPPAPGAAALGPLRPAAPGLVGHAAAVAWCRERIAAGDVFQANLCLRLEAAFTGDPAALASRLLTALRPSHGAFLAGPWGAAASASPELFLRREGGTVRTAPIKGTAAPEARERLVASAKDRAENVMIVDLMRNDLGRVCDYGSVEVEALCEPRETAGVWSLVSELRGTLRPGVGDGALVRATFPPGSVTGAPKVQATALIHELEATGRELYTGAIGLASPLAGLELSVAIRTVELRGERAWLGVGGGITWASDPAREVEECLVKARPVAEATGTRVDADAGEVRAAGVAGVSLARGARPDPASGLLATLRGEDGAAWFARRHVERLAAGVLELWGQDVAASAAALLTELAAQTAGAGVHRLRIAAEPAPDGSVRLTGEAVPEAPAADAPVVLCPALLPGGLGAHKWRDRDLVEDLARDLGGVPLLLDLDGTVLEAGWGSVFAIEDDGALVTPPADGRILPGVTRAALLELAAGAGLRAREEPLTLERLRAARGVVVTSGVRLVTAARLADGPAGDAGLVATLRELLEVAGRRRDEALAFA